MSFSRKSVRKSGGKGRRSLKFDAEVDVTPRNLIESMVASQTTAIPITRTRGRRSGGVAPPLSSGKKPGRVSVGLPNMESVVDKLTPRSNILGLVEQASERTAVLVQSHSRKSSTHSSLPDFEGVDINQVEFVAMETSYVAARQKSPRKPPHRPRQLQVTLKSPAIPKSAALRRRKRGAQGELAFSPDQPDSPSTPSSSPGGLRQDVAPSGEEEGSPRRGREGMPRSLSKSRSARSSTAEGSVKLLPVSVVLSPVDIPETSRLLVPREVDSADKEEHGNESALRASGEGSAVQTSRLDKSRTGSVEMPASDSSLVPRGRTSRGTPHPSRSASGFHHASETSVSKTASPGLKSRTQQSELGAGDDLSGSDADVGTVSGISRTRKKSGHASRSLDLDAGEGEVSVKVVKEGPSRTVSGEHFRAGNVLSDSPLDFKPALSSTRRETGMFHLLPGSLDDLSSDEAEEDGLPEIGPSDFVPSSSRKDRFPGTDTPKPSSGGDRQSTSSQAADSSGRQLTGVGTGDGETVQLTPERHSSARDGSSSPSDGRLSPIIPLGTPGAEKHTAAAAAAASSSKMESLHSVVSASERENFPLFTPPTDKRSSVATSSRRSTSTVMRSSGRKSTSTLVHSSGRKSTSTLVHSSSRKSHYTQTSLPLEDSSAGGALISPIRGEPPSSARSKAPARSRSPSLSPYVTPAKRRRSGDDRRSKDGRTKLEEAKSVPGRGENRSQEKTPGPLHRLQAQDGAVLESNEQDPPKKKPARKPRKAKNPNEHIPISTIKSLFTHFTNRRVSSDALLEVERVSAKFWKNAAEDLESYTSHRHRKTISDSDIKLLMRRQRFVTDDHSFHAAMIKYLPMELRSQIIPIARSGNRIEP